MPDLMQKQPEDSHSKWSKDGARLKATRGSIFDWRDVGLRLQERLVFLSNIDIIDKKEGGRCA
jgi:hypothetical protein